MFFSLKLNSPPFLSILFSSLNTVLQLSTYHKQMQHEPLQNGVRGVAHFHQGEPFVWKQLETSPSDFMGNSCGQHVGPASPAPLSHKVC